MNWRVAAVFLVAVIFAVAGLAAFFLLPLVPGVGELPRWAQAAAVLGIAWFASAGFGPGTPKRSAAVATACALAGALWVWWSAGAGIPGWEPAPVSAPENVPEGWVPFHFVSAFTYAGEEGDPELWGFEVYLPWPHVAKRSVGVPDNHFVPGCQYFELENGEEYVLWWDHPDIIATAPEELGSNAWSRLLWFRVAIERGDEVVLERRWENGEWVSMSGERYLLFWNVQRYGQDENIMPKAFLTMADPSTWQAVAPLKPGETVVLEGVFLAPEENENQVRMGDYATEGYGWIPSENRWAFPLKPEENGSPLLATGGPGAGYIKAEVDMILLEKFEDGDWVTVEKFYQEGENVRLNSWGFIDRATP